LFGLGGVVFAGGAILIPGTFGLYSLVTVSLFMSIMFPTIYGIALKNMGDEAKIGSAGLVMAIVGGALMPVLQGSILDWGGSGFADLKILGYIPEVNFSFILPLICLAVVANYGYRTHKRNI
ncbi:MAG: MFS transporter, partial [Flavicella sp.]